MHAEFDWLFHIVFPGGRAGHALRTRKDAGRQLLEEDLALARATAAQDISHLLPASGAQTHAKLGGQAPIRLQEQLGLCDALFILQYRQERSMKLLPLIFRSRTYKQSILGIQIRRNRAERQTFGLWSDIHHSTFSQPEAHQRLLVTAPDCVAMLAWFVDQHQRC